MAGRFEVENAGRYGENGYMRNEQLLVSNQLLTAEEVANILQVPVATIHAWRYRGKGPTGLKVGRHLRFRYEDVMEWIDDGCSA